MRRDDRKPTDKVDRTVNKNDRSSGAVAAYFQEFASESIAHNDSNHYGQYSTPLGLSLRRFCRFIEHGGLLSPDLDHSHLLEVFKEAAGGNAAAHLDLTSFRAALQSAAVRVYFRDQFGSMQAVREPTMQVALEELLRDVEKRRESVFDPCLMCGELEGAFFDAEVIEAAYSFSDAIGLLFPQFARRRKSKEGPQNVQKRWDFLKKEVRKKSFEAGIFVNLAAANADSPRENYQQQGRDPDTISGRAVCKLCCATGVVPGCVVAGELADVAHELAVAKYGTLSRAMKRYFHDERMQEGRRKQSRGVANIWEALEEIEGEPCYTFPELIQLLATAALYMPPRVHLEPPNVRASRVREIFARYLEKPGQRIHTNRSLTSELDGIQRQPSRTNTAGFIPPASLGETCAEIFAELEKLLPALPPPQECPELPKPGADKVMHSIASPPPESGDEELLTPQQREPPQKQHLEDAPNMRSYSLHMERRVTRTHALRVARSLGRKSGYTPVSWTNQVRWRMPKDKKKKNIPMSSTCLQYLQDASRREVGSGFERDVTTPILRMAIIDEPLRAPPCNCRDRAVANEVTGLVEAALTSRRLRRYDAARTLLMQAHTIWTKLNFDTEADKSKGTNATTGSSWDSILKELEKSNCTDASNVNSTGPSWESILKDLDTGDVAQDLLAAEVGLFFFCELASLGSAMGEDGAAMQLLWRARHYSNRLPPSHPDTAVVWGGMGRIAFRMGYVEVAARAAHRARCIREATVGEDTVEAATAYNNVACCLAALERPFEAAAYLELAAELMRVLAGEEHPRTQTVTRNLHQARLMRKNVHMDPPILFSFRVRATKDRCSTSRSKRRHHVSTPRQTSRGSSKRQTSRGSSKERRARSASRERLYGQVSHSSSSRSASRERLYGQVSHSPSSSPAPSSKWK